MLILTALTAIAFANPDASALVDCREAATVADASGTPQVVGTLYRSCLQAEELEELDVAFNPWLPEMDDEQLVVTDGLLHMMVDLADGCRHEAVYLDASGQPRVNGGEVRRCMADGGFSRTRPALARKQIEEAHPQAVASAE